MLKIGLNYCDSAGLRIGHILAAASAASKLPSRDSGSFSYMSNFQQLFQLGQQVQARLTQLQSELGNRTVTCSSGGGMVTVTVDGRGRIREIKIDRTVVDPEDVEMLEDLVLAALNEAQQRAQSLYEEEMKKLAGGLPPLPFNL